MQKRDKDEERFKEIYGSYPTNDWEMKQFKRWLRSEKIIWRLAPLKDYDTGFRY